MSAIEVQKDRALNETINSAPSSEPSFAEGIVAVRRGVSTSQGVNQTSPSVNPLQIPRGWDDSLLARPPREMESYVEPEYPTGVNIAPLSELPRIDTSGVLSSYTPEHLLGSVDNLALKNTEVKIDNKTTKGRLSLLGKSKKTQKDLSLDSTAITKNSSRKNIPGKYSKLTLGGIIASESPWKAVAMPVGVFFVVLVLIAASLRLSTAFASGFSAITLPGAVQPSPSGLVIRSANYSRVTLDGGQVIGVISGSITNRGGESVQQVLFEGSLFDSAGKLIKSTISPAESQLTKTKIKTLTVDLLKDIQGAKTSRKDSLHPGETQNFTIAFLDGEHKKARHYSTRVYAVKGVSR